MAEIGSPSPSLAVSGAPSMTDRGPGRLNPHPRGLAGPSDLFGPTGARPMALRAGEPGPKTRPRARGLFGVDPPTPSVPPHTAPPGTQPVTNTRNGEHLMSAFIVDDEHIHVLVWAASTFGTRPLRWRAS